MIKQTYFVYRFLDIEDDIIYVGKTKNLQNRIKQHFSSSGHLSPDCYSQVETIQYLEFVSKIDMDINELYYINKWKPRYNSKDKHYEESTVKLDENTQWKPFIPKTEEYIKELEERVEKLNSTIKDITVENSSLADENERLQNRTERVINYIMPKTTANKNIDDMLTFTELRENWQAGFFNDNLAYRTTISTNGIEKYDILVTVEDGHLFIEELNSGKKVDWNDPRWSNEEFRVLMLAESGYFESVTPEILFAI
jgi:regulator of replication initiation timing/predicted GIY-YIG superfamily endonuclease